jgi:formylglycine-generating enzyme required for sulfatase activity
MPWPLSQDHNEAVQDPRLCFADDELRAGQVATNALGLPMPRSGNFADVYELRSAAGERRWAVKCFTRAVPGQRERYAAISDHLRRARLRFAVEFQYLEQGIRVSGQWYPVLKMDWVDGLLLNEFVRNYLDRPAMLEALAHLWAKLAGKLRNVGIAHGDLQHGNVLLVPGRDEKHLALKLIDYDGMYVPALARVPSGEVGHPSYQHPLRLRDATYNAEVDRFPLLVMYVAIRALTVGGRFLWDRYDNGDNLLFRRQDFEAPNRSPLFAELLKVDDPTIRLLTEKLIDAARQSLTQTPLLDELISSEPTSADAGDRWWTWPDMEQRVEDSRLLPRTESAIANTPPPAIVEAVMVAAPAPVKQQPDGSTMAAQTEFASLEPAGELPVRRRPHAAIRWLLAGGFLLGPLAALAVLGIAMLLSKDSDFKDLASIVGGREPAGRKDRSTRSPEAFQPVQRKAALGEQALGKDGKMQAPLPTTPSDWTEASTFLSDLAEQNVQVDTNWFSKNGTVKDAYGRIHTVIVDGVQHPHSIFMHPSPKSYSSVSYAIGKPYAKFIAKATIPRLIGDQDDPATAVTFEVLGDGKSLWKSRPLEKRGDIQECDVELQSCQRLELRAHCPGAANYAWAVWLEPRIIWHVMKPFKNSLGMEFVLVPKGNSWLGGGGGKPADRDVEVSQDFYLGKYEVTQEEWEKVMGNNPSYFSRTGQGKDAVQSVPDAELRRFPVESVTWHDTQLFLAKLNWQVKNGGWVYRLPTEVEWEYACRGGPLADRQDSTFDWYFDKPTNQLLPEQANFDLKRTCKVGSCRPNALGLYDMHGNVWEWCDDRTVDTRNLLHLEKGESQRVERGGCWHDGPGSPFRCTSARISFPPTHRVNDHGLRLARVPIGKKTGE